VREVQMPVRDAHHVTGRVVKLAETAGLTLDAVPLADLQTIEPRLTQAVFSVLCVDSSVRSRTSYGGTAPQNVAKMAALWIERLETPAKPG